MSVVFGCKKMMATAMILSSLLSMTCVPAFAVNEEKESVKAPSSTSVSLIMQLDKPGLTVSGPGGKATINWMAANRSISWSVIPDFFGPYYYNVNVLVVRMDGSYAYDEDFKGLSIGGTHSDVTESLKGLAPGRYYATLTGRCIFDPGYADIAPGAKIPIDIY